MTRDEFIAKIENPDDVERVMARIDEGAKLLGKSTTEELEKWYDECAGYYDAAHEDVITKYEQVGVEFNPIYGEEREVLKPVDKAKWFSFLHFNAMISEAMDRYRYMMYTVKLEDSITSEVGEAKMSLKKKVDDYVARPGNLYNDPSFVHKVHKVVAKYLGEYALAADTRAQDLSDAIAVLKIKEDMDEAREHGHPIQYYIQSVSFKPNEGSAYRIKGEKALNLMADVFVPYFCDRYLSKFNLKSLEAEQKRWLALKAKTFHMTIYEIYKLFIEFYNEKFSYELDEDRYNLGERNGKYPGLVNEISVWIYDLMAEISDEYHKENWRTEKVDAIKTRMLAKLYGLDKVDLPKEWKAFMY